MVAAVGGRDEDDREEAKFPFLLALLLNFSLPPCGSPLQLTLQQGAKQRSSFLFT